MECLDGSYDKPVSFQSSVEDLIGFSFYQIVYQPTVDNFNLNNGPPFDKF